jgi:hypothetical protein
MLIIQEARGPSSQGDDSLQVEDPEARTSKLERVLENHFQISSSLSSFIRYSL